MNRSRCARTLSVRRARQIDQDGLSQLDDAHVGDHPPLGGQQRGVTAGARRQRLDVVGEQPLQVGPAIRASQQRRPSVDRPSEPGSRIAWPRIRCCYPVSMRFHCTALLAVLLSAAPAAAQQNLPTPATGEATFNILFKGIQVGREQVTLSRGSAGWIITSSGTVRPADQPDHPSLRDEVHRRLAAARAEDRSRAAQRRHRAGDLVQHDDRDQRGQPERHHELQRGSDHGTHSRPAEQLLRQLRGARRAPRRRARSTRKSRSTWRRRPKSRSRSARSPTQTLDRPDRHDATFDDSISPSTTRARRSTARSASTTGLDSSGSSCPRRASRSCETTRRASRCARQIVAQSDRRRRHHSRQRLQPRRHADHAADGCRSAALSGDRAGRRLGTHRPR